MGQRLEQMLLPKYHTQSQQIQEEVAQITNHQGNSNQNHMRYYLLEWLLFKKTHKSQQVLARMWRNWNHCTMLVGMQDIVATVQNCWRFLKKLKVELLYDPAILLLDIFPEELKSGSQISISIFVFIAALLTITKMWIQAKCPSLDEWIKKMWYIHIMECCSAIKKKEILHL